MNRVFIAFCLTVMLSNDKKVAAQNPPDYEQRRLAYIDTALVNFVPNAITLQAYKGVPVDAAALNDIFATILTKSTVDFNIVKLIRVLYFTNGAYDSLILPQLNQFPYWLTKDEELRSYWSENHNIMWMGSDWLLHERYGKPIDNTLDARLRHYLRLKGQYGFYEFFSSTYIPYCLTGLLNLADFAQDLEIKTLATEAAQVLLKDLLMLTNDKGVFFPAAGRNYYPKYAQPYRHNHSNLIYLLTGFGPPPEDASHAGGFLASSTLPVDDVINSWTAELDTLYSIGHSLDTGFIINQDMAWMDRIIFQWSSGAYFNPEVALETGTLLVDSNLWNHVDFEPVSQFSLFPVQDLPMLANTFSSISKSSLISGQDIAIFKHNSVTLSSIQDFWKGKLGYQQFPCVANVGTTAVMTASGKVYSDWSERTRNNTNEHLPYVEQEKNVALIMYRPEPKPALLNYNNPEVALYWSETEFDEIRNDSPWLLGRQGNSYVAVRRSCLGEIDSVIACDISNEQTWVIVVGDSGMYSSFSNFQSIIQNSEFEEDWYYDSVASQSVYYAKIEVDAITIDYAWSVDSTLTTGISRPYNEVDLTIFPNPASGNITIDLSFP